MKLQQHFSDDLISRIPGFKSKWIKIQIDSKSGLWSCDEFFNLIWYSKRNSDCYMLSHNYHSGAAIYQNYFFFFPHHFHAGCFGVFQHLQGSTAYNPCLSSALKFTANPLFFLALVISFRNLKELKFCLLF